MKAEMETLTSIIRVFKEGKSYGDAYEFSAAVRWINPERVEIMGTLRAPRPSEWRAMQECLKAHGAKELLIVKSTPEGMKDHIYSLDKTEAKKRRGHL